EPSRSTRPRGGQGEHGPVAPSAGAKSCGVAQVVARAPPEHGWIRKPPPWHRRCRGRDHALAAATGDLVPSPPERHMSPMKFPACLAVLSICTVAACSSNEAAPAHAKCHDDTECKGDLVCSAGKCVEPSGDQGSAASSTGVGGATSTC